MGGLLQALDWFAVLMAWLGAVLVLLNLALVLLRRGVSTYRRTTELHLTGRYAATAQRALHGDAAALRTLAALRPRQRLQIARRLIAPLYERNDPALIAPLRALFRAMSLVDVADRYLQSRWWWRRVLAIRILGILQVRARTQALVAALDDRHAEVRASALDALADLRDPASLSAIVARVHDESLPRGRRHAALAAFGAVAEPLLLEMAGIDAENRLNYAIALRVCGSARALPTLCAWSQDADAQVRAAALEAMVEIPLDQGAVNVARRQLESDDAAVRAMAAHALQGWIGADGAAAHVARHLADTWPVAVRASRTLLTMGEPGLAALRASAAHSGLAGELARHTLWATRESA